MEENTVEVLVAAERAAREALDTAKENLASARRDNPLFTPVSEELYYALEVARDTWYKAYDALYQKG